MTELLAPLALRVQRTYQPDLTTSRSQRIIEGLAVPYGRPTLVSDDGITIYDEEWAFGVFRSALEPSSRGRVRLNFTHDETSPFTWVGRTLMLAESSEGLVGQWKVDESPFGDVALEKADTGQTPGLSVSADIRANVMRAHVRVRTDALLRHVALVEQPAFAEALVSAVRERQIPDVPVVEPDPVVPAGPRRVDQLGEWLRSQERRVK